MRWKDVLTESVLEKEGKSKQEKPKATEGPPHSPLPREEEEGRELRH